MMQENRRALLAECCDIAGWRTMVCPVCGILVAWYPPAEDEPETCGDDGCKAVYARQMELEARMEAAERQMVP